MAPRIYTGRFDPKFLGVAIRAKRSSEVHSFRLHDRGQKAPIPILTTVGDDAFISDLSRQTVLDHEIRHFHDTLLYPFGHATTRARIITALNGFNVAMILKRIGGEANALAVPLQRWLLMIKPERDAFLQAEGRRIGRDLRTPELPVLSPDYDLGGYNPGVLRFPTEQEALVVGCRIVLVGYQRMEDLWRAPHGAGDEVISPAIDIWEASGLLCQLAAIEAITNSDLMNRFLRWVRDHGPRTYRQGLQVLAWCLEVIDWRPTLRNLLTLTTWAQLGSFKSEVRTPAPSSRLGRIVAAAQQGKRWPSDCPFIDLVRSWDEVTEADSVAGLTDSGIDFTRSVIQRTGQDHRVTRLLGPSLLPGLGAAQQQMLAAFLNDPDGYVDPAAYLAGRASYPVPCVGITFPTGSEAEAEWVDATPAGWSPVIDMDTTLGLTVMAELADAIFLPGEKSLQTTARAEVRSRLDLEAVRIIR